MNTLRMPRWPQEAKTEQCRDMIGFWIILGTEPTSTLSKRSSRPQPTSSMDGTHLKCTSRHIYQQHWKHTHSILLPPTWISMYLPQSSWFGALCWGSPLMSEHLRPDVMENPFIWNDWDVMWLLFPYLPLQFIPCCPTHPKFYPASSAHGLTFTLSKHSCSFQWPSLMIILMRCEWLVGWWVARLMECIWQSALKGCCRLLAHVNCIFTFSF